MRNGKQTRNVLWLSYLTALRVSMLNCMEGDWGWVWVKEIKLKSLKREKGVRDHRTHYQRRKKCTERELWRSAEEIFWVFSIVRICKCMQGKHPRLGKETPSRIRESNTWAHRGTEIMFIPTSQNRNILHDDRCKNS